MTFPEIYLLRHGQTFWNAENRMQGWLNSALTPQGEMEAARQFEILRGRDLSGFSFFSSPLGRAVQTAAIACGPLAETIHTDERLKEIGVGEWSGQLRSALPVPSGDDPELAQYEMAPGGEGYHALQDRLRAFLTDLAGPAVLVTHGVAGHALRGLVLAPGHAATSVHEGQGTVFHLLNGEQKILS